MPVLQPEALTEPLGGPAEEYRRRLAARLAERSRWLRLEARYGYARLAVFAAGILLTIAAYRDLVPGAVLLIPVVVFAVLVRQHDIVIRRRQGTARAIAYYERGLARIEDRWAASGDTGERFGDDQHLYAHDLDLFGRGSLFQLLSIAGTPSGEETLARWLKLPAEPDEIAHRQRAVAELTPALDLRESIGRPVDDDRGDVHTAPLLAWAEAPRMLTPDSLQWLAALCTVLVLVAIAVRLTTGSGLALLVVLVAQSLFAWPQLRRTEHVLHSAASVTRDLDILAHLLERFEREAFSSARLTALQQQLRMGTVPASRAIRALHRLVEVHEWQDNLVFLILSMPLLLGTHLSWAIERWRGAHGHHIRQWLQAAGEFEALASLSAYRYEHPQDPFPILSEADGRAACYHGQQLGHPLLPAAAMVRNDVQLDDSRRLLVVSGSNMSGKSTLLRTVGINAVLAFAGAPVRATRLVISPLAIGATLRIQDSLQEGRSRFYAEIMRLRQLADIAQGRRPLLFLLDELFHGTNSHDRLVGAAGVLRSLLDRGAIGLVTTHDLALTAIVDQVGAGAANVHFEEWFDAGEMRFDYRVKDGPVTRSNALALMRAVGLEVESDE